MIDLPKHNQAGKPKISYSQVNTWGKEPAFNQIMGEDGKLKSIDGYTGYILKYFMDFQFPESPMGIYAPFGSKVEDYICKRIVADFDPEERKVLDTIVPLGTFQHEIEIDFGDFVLCGFIDDANKETEDPEHPLYLSHIRDYKTASEKSSKQYFKDDYFQLDVYSLKNYMEKGTLPSALEVCIIERTGSHIKPPLKVGKNIWWVQRPVKEERLMVAKNKIITIVQEISDVYQVYKAINGQ